MSEYAKNIQTIEDMWKKRIELRDRGGRMSEYIVEVTGQMPDAIYERELTEIVRCRDCKHLNKLSREHEVYECCLTYMNVALNGFCAWAERREP